jgi:protein-disulfide isomerase/uncharacterized membrane protein
MQETVTSYLDKLNIPVSKTYCEKLLLSHPDYPSLLSISDTLQQLGVAHQAARISTDQLMDMEVPYLAQFKEGEGLSLIKSKQELSEHLQKYNGEHSATGHQPAMEHAVVLMAQPTDRILDPENRVHLEAETVQKILSVALLSAITGLLLLAAAEWFSWWYVTFIMTALAGGVVGYLLIGKDIGVTYSPVESFCRAGKRSNCDAVLNSEAARLFGRVSLSDAVAGYFLFQILVLGLFIPYSQASDSFLLALAVLSVSAVPVVFYSLYYQSIRAKTWCRLCLIVDAALLVQAGLFAYLVYSGIIGISFVEPYPVVISLLLFLLVITCVLLLKDTLKNAKESERNEIQALRVKNSPEVFTNLLFREKKVDTTPFERELLIGNQDAPVRITMAASLRCGPCKDGFEKTLQVVKTFPDKANLAVRFKHYLTDNGQSISDQNPLLTYWLHHIYGKDHESERTANLIRDWYSQMDNEKFKAKYSTGIDGLSFEVEKSVNDHNNWFETSDVQGTPTFFMNGYQLPRQYRIEDLIHLVVGFSEEIPVAREKTREAKVEQNH